MSDLTDAIEAIDKLNYEILDLYPEQAELLPMLSLVYDSIFWVIKFDGECILRGDEGRTWDDEKDDYVPWEEYLRVEIMKLMNSKYPFDVIKRLCTFNSPKE